MISYIKGTYICQKENGIVIETPMGLAFDVSVPLGSPIYKNHEGDEIIVYTKMVVREDDVSLYGFHNKETLDFFNLITTVSGIGPKSGIQILGSMSIDELRQAIIFQDIKTLSKANGVGKKTAERIVLELKDKVGELDINNDFKVDITDIKGDNGDSRSEAISALVSLGYSKQEAFKAVSMVSEEKLDSEGYIKKALKNLF